MEGDPYHIFVAYIIPYIRRVCRGRFEREFDEVMNVDTLLKPLN
jgi:hypothetical protein